MAKTGRPRKEFDWQLVDALLGLEASEDYVAEMLMKKDNVEPNKQTIASYIKLIQRRIRERFDLSFVQYRAKRMEGRKLKLREAQWKCALEKHNATLLIWLGKQYLGQSDKVQIEEENELDTDVQPYEKV